MHEKYSPYDESNVNTLWTQLDKNTTMSEYRMSDTKKIPIFPILGLSVVDGIPNPTKNIKFESSSNFLPKSTFYTICVTEENTQHNATLGSNLTVEEAPQFCRNLGKKILRFQDITNFKTFSLSVKLQVSENLINFFFISFKFSSIPDSFRRSPEIYVANNTKTVEGDSRANFLLDEQFHNVYNFVKSAKLR